MSQDDQADRTLPPTDRRRREARARGQIPRSPDLAAAIILLVASVTLQFLAPSIAADLAKLLRRGLTSAASSRLTIASAGDQFASLGQIVLMSLLPVCGLMLLTAVLANLIQTGWVWNSGALLPRFRAHSVWSSERMWGAGWWTIRLLTLGGVAWYYFRSHSWQIASLGSADPAAMLSSVLQMVGAFTIQLSLCLLLFAVVDYGYRYWRDELSLRMTAEERRQEQRDEEIDPRLKARRGGSRATAISPSQVERVAGIAE